MLSPLLVLVYAIPGFLVGAGVAWLVRHDVTTPHNYAVLVGGSNARHSLWGPVQSVWTTNRDQRIVGFFASVFLGRRPVRAVAEDLQGYLAAQEGRAREAAAVISPAELSRPDERRDRRGGRHARREDLRLGSLPLSTATLVGLALAGFGFWVLAYKA